MQRKIIKVTALLCVAIFVYLIIRANPKELLRLLGRLSAFGIITLILLRLLFWGLRTWSWRTVLGCCSRCPVSFATLFWAEMAGHAVGHFTPSAKLGGDAIRAMMLGPVPKNQSLASVVVDKTIELIATILMMSLGLFITLARIRMGSTQRLVFLSLTAFTAALIAVFFRQQRKGLFVWILECLKKLHIRSRYLEAKRERLIETDVVIADFYANHRRRFLQVFLQYIAMTLLWAVEMHLSFYFIGMHTITPLKSFLITMLGIVANIVPVIPAGIGIYDMSYLPIFAIFSVPLRYGITVVLLRRLLNLLMAAIGLLPMLRLRARPPVKGEVAAVPISSPPAENN
ncbi:MAG: flippase-like domain-containing protein [Acidobacteria bacterium]|jgi:uncharacterized protein (TIRG00374 family)|nr:flippase-like domain-containing protein [Acidobacteriota bacterium]